MNIDMLKRYSVLLIDTFRSDFIENKDFKDRFKNGNQIMYGAYSKEKLLSFDRV
jgi:hypothetical protein